MTPLTRAAMLATAVGLAILAPAVSGAAIARGEPAVLVWPARPDIDASGAASGAAQAGYRAVDFAPIAARLRALGELDADRARAAFDRVQHALGAARRAYLDQRFDDMLSALAIDDAAREVVARPEHREMMWELQFQTGLAYWSRKRSGDAEQAARQFALALALDRDSKPDVAVYGPDVVNAFGAALGQVTALAPRPVSLAVTPADARVVIDGAVVLPGQAAPSLRPGLHVVHAGAPGYASRAVVVDIDGDSRVALALVARPADDPIDRLGPAWAAGELRAHTATGQALIGAIGRAAGADVVAVVDADTSGGFTARLVSAGSTAGDGAGGAGRVASATTADAAVARALTGPAPADLARTPAGGESRPAPVYKRWWFWTLVGASAVLVGAGAARAREKRARLEVFVRPLAIP